MPKRPCFFGVTRPHISPSASVGLSGIAAHVAGSCIEPAPFTIKVFRIEIYLSGVFDHLTGLGFRVLSILFPNSF